MNTAHPLDSFPIVRTTDGDEMSAALGRVYIRPALQCAGKVRRLDARLNECSLPTVGLGYSTYGAPVAVEFPTAAYFVQHLPLRGRGEIVSRGRSVALAAGQTCAISPDAGYRARYSGDYAALVLKIDARALTRKLAAMTGAAIAAPLQIDLQPNESQRIRTLCRYLPVLAGMLSDCAAPPPVWWVSQTEQLLMAMFLCGHRHNYGHLLEQEAPDCAPWQVRRAEDYIEANWQAGVTLEALAEVTGVSGFSLFRSFRKVRGYSPFQYASEVRSKHMGFS